MMENMVNKVKEQAAIEKEKAVAEATKEISNQKGIELAKNLILLDKNSYQEIALVTKIDIEEIKKLAAELGK